MRWIADKKKGCAKKEFLSQLDTSRLTMNNNLQTKRTNSDVPMEVRHAIVASLFGASKEGRCPKGTIPSIAAKYRVSKRTVYCLKNKAVKQLQDGVIDLTTQRKNCGRKSKYEPLVLQEDLEKIPLSQRTTSRDAARALGLPQATFQYQIKTQGFAKRHSNALKPLLSEEHKKARLDFVKSFIADPRTGQLDPLFDYVHVDEKIFLITKKRQSYYLSTFEEIPHRTAASTRHTTQVMVLAAFARPRFDPTTNRWFDGKIGCWAFVEYVAAKRSSKNRPKGTIEPKSLKVTRDVYREFLVHKVFPAIKDKWPRSYFDSCRDRSKPIWVQQDNCRVHVSPDDPSIVAAGK